MLLPFFLAVCVGLAVAGDPEADMTGPEIILYWGYPAQIIRTTTADGYILTMHRIPWGINGPGSGHRPAVYIQHGLEASSSSWISNLPDKAFAFMLADAGFDVFLGNVRGNMYSLGHTTLNTSGHEYWRFSWDEMAKYDLEAMINKALQISNQTSLYYIGHSQGTLLMFSKLSTDPEFGSKLKKFFAMAPVGTVRDIQGLLSYLAKDFYESIEFLYDVLGEDQFLPHTWLLTLIKKLICGDAPQNGTMCDSLIFLIGGPESNQINVTRLPVFLADMPAGTSTMNIIHWCQMVRSGLQQMYDWGSRAANLEHYGVPISPIYDISRIRTDIHMYYSDSDWLADESDIQRHLLTGLPANSLKQVVRLHDFNHFDFVMGNRAAPEIYRPMIETMLADHTERNIH